MKYFTVLRLGKRFVYRAERVIIIRDGDVLHRVPVNPALPPGFDTTPNEQRDARSRALWCLPYIVTYTQHDFKTPFPNWLRDWPDGTRYDVRCLDGGAWDRSTVWGCFGTEVEAIVCATGPGR